MSSILSNEHISQYKQDGAVLIKDKFDDHWIKILKQGFEKAKFNPSPRFTNHTKSPNSPKYLEDFWTWNLHKEFEDFVFNSPTAKIASELLGANQINLVMDNWFLEKLAQNQNHHFIMIFLILILRDLCVFCGYH